MDARLSRYRFVRIGAFGLLLPTLVFDALSMWIVYGFFNPTQGDPLPSHDPLRGEMLLGAGVFSILALLMGALAILITVVSRRSFTTKESRFIAISAIVGMGPFVAIVVGGQLGLFSR